LQSWEKDTGRRKRGGKIPVEKAGKNLDEKRGRSAQKKRAVMTSVWRGENAGGTSTDCASQEKKTLKKNV